MEFYKRVLKLHPFRNLGRKSPAKLLLNSSFEKHGGLVVLVGENNVGKSNVLEALTIFNDADVKLCSEEDYFKAHEKDSLLSLEEETSLDHKITGFSCVDLKIQSKEVNKGLKELSKILISYPFCVFVGSFINLIMSYGTLDSFLKSYKEKLKLSTFSTRQANNLLFKKLIKHLSGNNELVKNFCQYIREILEYNMQLKIDSLITKEFNRFLAIAQDSSQNSYQLKIRVRHNNKFYDYSKKYTAYEIKLEVYDCRKSHDHNEPIILSQQSTGFQWAFNFMFGFLYNVGSHFSFNHNIIYVMDEPATPLSVPARKEFRRFLKKYAHKNHVTFVLATHDPFLVDTDHLDEIRIVEKEAEGSVIKNHFNYPLNNASKDSDALDKIKRSLGVGQHVFHNPQKHRIIFVEGITDYCYLSAFKLYFNEREFKDNPIPFTFLPISGLKNNPNDMEETIKKLCELDNHPIVLTDDDRKDGSDPQKAKSEEFKNANEEMHDPIRILQLSKCDENFKQIEDCFSENDRKEYAKNKCKELAMAFKTRLLYGGKDDVMSEETKENFKKLFEWIKKSAITQQLKKNISNLIIIPHKYYY